MLSIIPLQEKTGNYDNVRAKGMRPNIIPLREKTGNYDRKKAIEKDADDYTTTRENWELRLMLLNLTRIVESVLASSEDSVEQELRRLELEFEKLQMD